MQRRLERLTLWGRSTLERLKRRSWRVWLVALVLLYALLEVGRGFVGDTTTLLLVWAFEGALWLVAQPMGIGGLVLLVVGALLLGLSWWETRPPRREPGEPRRELSDDERRSIQDHRTIWNRHGKVAVSQLHVLLRDAVYELRPKLYWADLINPVVNGLEDGINSMDRAVAFESDLSIEQVRDQFNGMYSAYLRGIAWTARLHQREGVDLEGRFEERLGWWKENHYEFWDRLLDLQESPQHHQTLKIFVRFIDDPAYAQLLRSAEKRTGDDRSPEAELSTSTDQDRLGGQPGDGEHGV